MTYDSPLWAFDGEVITAVANFKEEGLVTQEGGKEEKGILKFIWTSVTCAKGKSVDHHTTWTLV